MRIALVHDYIKEYGGAERVLEALHEVWPDAPVFTSVYLPEYLGPHKERFKKWDIRTSWLQYIPFNDKLISPFRLLAPFAFKSFDFSQFDVVIVSATGAYSPNMIRTTKNKELKTENKKEGAVHICYCHTPPRYLYGYATAREWKKNPVLRIVGELANHVLRIVDSKSSENVDYFIANSKNIAGRIQKFYRRESTVIYPPVEIQELGIRNKELGERKNHNSKFILHNSNYFLAGGRLARPKHIDLIVRACRELRVPLKVFGKGFAGYEYELKIENGKLKNDEKKTFNSQLSTLNSNIEFVGEVTDEEKLELMRNAKAYIFAAEDEDFGITPVEAMAQGTPVIAYRSGGVVESVIDGKTGIFFDTLSVESLALAIKQFNNKTINASDCIQQAARFSKERFKTEIMHFVLKVATKE